MHITDITKEDIKKSEIDLSMSVRKKLMAGCLIGLATVGGMVADAKPAIAANDSDSPYATMYDKYGESRVKKAEDVVAKKEHLTSDEKKKLQEFIDEYNKQMKKQGYFVCIMGGFEYPDFSKEEVGKYSKLRTEVSDEVEGSFSYMWNKSKGLLGSISIPVALMLLALLKSKK